MQIVQCDVYQSAAQRCSRS